MRHFRFVFAAVIAPLSAPVTIIFLQLIVRGNLSLYNDPDISLIMWSSMVAAYVGLLVAVLPIIHALQILQRVSLGAIVVAGAISGIVVYLVFQALLGFVLNIAAISLIEVIPIAILSILVASVFGLIAGVNNLREIRIAE